MPESNSICNLGKSECSNGRAKLFRMIIRANLLQFFIRKPLIDSQIQNHFDRPALISRTNGSMCGKNSLVSHHFQSLLKRTICIHPVLAEHIQCRKHTVPLIQMQNVKMITNHITQFYRTNAKNHFLHQALCLSIIFSNAILTIQIIGNFRKNAVFWKRCVQSIMIPQNTVFPHLDLDFPIQKRNRKNNSGIFIVNTQILMRILILHPFICHSLLHIPIFIKGSYSKKIRFHTKHGPSSITIKCTQSTRVVTTASRGFHTHSQNLFGT